MHWHLCYSFFVEINPYYRPSAGTMKANVGEDCRCGVLHKFGYSSRKSEDDTFLAYLSDSGCFLWGKNVLRKNALCPRRSKL